MSQPIKDREQFFKLVEEGLQRYFSECDRHWGGILHLTVGVKCGKVGGIIKSDNMLSYEGFTLHRVETILKYALPKYMSRAEVPFAMETILDGLRNYEEEKERPPLIARKRDSLVLINQQSSQPTLLPRRPKEGTQSSLKKNIIE